jgi:hypothetical protein
VENLLGSQRVGCEFPMNLLKKQLASREKNDQMKEKHLGKMDQQT